MDLLKRFGTLPSECAFSGVHFVLHATQLGGLIHKFVLKNRRVRTRKESIMPNGGYPKDGLGLQVPATVKKRPSHQFAIHDPIFSAFLGELGALAVKLSSMIRRCGPHRPTGFKNRSLPSPELAFASVSLAVATERQRGRNFCRRLS